MALEIKKSIMKENVEPKSTDWIRNLQVKIWNSIKHEESLDKMALPLPKNIMLWNVLRDSC